MITAFSQRDKAVIVFVISVIVIRYAKHCIQLNFLTLWPMSFSLIPIALRGKFSLPQIKQSARFAILTHPRFQTFP
jgi:hypothetical protein